MTLATLSQKYGMVPGRLYKFLDCLESLGLVRREQKTDALIEARYTAVPGLRAAAEKVVGAAVAGAGPGEVRLARAARPPAARCCAGSGACRASPSTGRRGRPSRWRASRRAWPRAWAPSSRCSARTAASYGARGSGCWRWAAETGRWRRTCWSSTPGSPWTCTTCRPPRRWWRARETSTAWASGWASWAATSCASRCREAMTCSPSCACCMTGRRRRRAR